MDGSRTTPIAVVGGGPVGLMLALFLDRHGVPCVVFDAAGTVADQPRGSTHNARTMEHYRRLGLAAQVRGVGLPPEHSAGISFFTRYAGHLLAELPWPGGRETRRRVAKAERTDQVPEPMHRANQMYVERLLLEQARGRPGITLRFGSRVTEVRRQADRVRLTVARAGRETAWSARYAVGCDGGRSLVRRALGVRYEGEGALDQEVLGRHSTAAHLRVPGLYRRFLRDRAGWSNWVVNADLALNLIALNGRDEFFLLTSSVGGGRVTGADLADLVRRAAGAEIPVEVLAHRPWTAGAALVAERFGDGRLLLAGDAAHLFTPNGGFGMNTGIDDAANLAWKLAAAVQGWAGSGLLASYEAERRPVALRNTAAARGLGTGLGRIERPAALEEDSAAGDAARATAGRELADYGMRTLATLGVQLGARYDGSPVVVPDGDAPPPDDFTSYTPSAVPGGRAPHLWLDDHHGPQSSLFDRLGTGFTLLHLGGPDGAAEDMAKAAWSAGIPLDVLRPADPLVRELYGRDLVLIRPDQHVAWRGNRPGQNPGAPLAAATGKARS